MNLLNQVIERIAWWFVRPQEWDSRVEELEEQWLNAVRERFPRDKEKRERLILAFQFEQAALRCATKEANKKVEEQKDRRKKRKLKDREPGLPPDVDVTKAYFKRAVHPKSDMSLPRQRTRIGVPLVNEAQEPFQRRREWIVPAVPEKAAPNPPPPWATSNLAEASVRGEIGSSDWSSDATSTTEASSASTI